MIHLHRRDRPCTLLAVYSAGGHRKELTDLLHSINPTSVVCASFRPVQPIAFDRAPVFQRTVELTHPRRSPLRLVMNVLQSLGLLVGHRPCLVASSGADVAVPVFVLAGLWPFSKTLYLESGGELGPTLSGRLCYPFSDLFIAQWPEQREHYPRAQLLKEPLL